MNPNDPDFDIERGIEDEGAYKAAMSAVTRRQRPPAVLRFIVQALEGYRAKRKMGWSRPWNKYHMITYQSFRLDFPADSLFINAARDVLATECENMPEDARAFVDDLLSDENVMGFVFVHDLTDPMGGRYEGVTLGFGRKAKERRFRDRIDLVFEAPVGEDDCAGAPSRLHVFIDPYRGQKDKGPLWTASFEGDLAAPTALLFEVLSNASWDWAEDESRLWDHWTSSYIDYFAPRDWPLRQSHFWVPGHPEARPAAALVMDETAAARLAADTVSG